MFEISTLKEKKISELQEIANELGIKKTAGIKKLDLAYKIIDHYASNPKASDKTIESKEDEVKKDVSEVKKDLVESKKTDNTLAIRRIIDLLKKKKTTIKTIEIDTKNLILNLMELLKVKVF